MMGNGKCAVCCGKLRSLISYDRMPDRAQLFETTRTNGITLEVMECSSCGLVQVDRDPVWYHREGLRATSLSEEMKAFRAEQFAEFVEHYGMIDKPVIELGSSEHEKLLTEAGMRYVRDADIAKAFVMLSVLEHLPDPLYELRRITAEVGIVEVPNADMIFETGLFSEFMVDHLFYFSNATFRRTLELGGFVVHRIKPVWHEYILSATVERRVPRDTLTLRLAEMQVRGDIYRYASSFDSIAVYGAGHQALMLLSLLQLGDKVKYVVDDTPFKQGRIAPASGYPIVPANALKNGPVDALIIMAGSFSEEIADKPHVKELKNVAVVGPGGLRVVR